MAIEFRDSMQELLEWLKEEARSYRIAGDNLVKYKYRTQRNSYRAKMYAYEAVMDKIEQLESESYNNKEEHED